MKKTKTKLLLILFGIIAVFAIMSCEATVGGGNTDSSNQNFLNGTTWKSEHDYQNDDEEQPIPIITMFSFTKTNFTFKAYYKESNQMLGHIEGTYVYNAEEKKVSITITNIIIEPEDNEDTVGETTVFEIIDGTKMKHRNADNYYTKQ